MSIVKDMFVVLFWSGVIMSIGFNITQYYDIQNLTVNRDFYGNAPDGIYRVFYSGYTKDGNVYFPVCDCCPTELHGDWKVEDGIVFNENHYWYKVALINNIIVYIWVD